MIFEKFKSIKKLILKSFLDIQLKSKQKDNDYRLFSLVSNETNKAYLNSAITLDKYFINILINDMNANLNTFFKKHDAYYNSFTIMLNWIFTTNTEDKFKKDNSENGINHINDIILIHLNKIDWFAVIPKTNLTVKDYVKIKLKNPIVYNTTLFTTLNTAILNAELHQSLKKIQKQSINNLVKNKTSKI